jgi:hypothetical protein
MAKSFLERVQPSRQRWKMIDWPFPVEGGEQFKVKLRVLTMQESEEAYLATMDHFKVRKLSGSDPAFALRERAELVFRAYSIEGNPLADDVEELVKQPLSIIDELHSTWRQFQADVCAVPTSGADMDALVELLKKKVDAALLSALPSSWLIALITTLASQLPPSMPANELG